MGKTPFAAVNFIMPFLMILGAFGFMFGTGGSALISMTMGTGDKQKAKRIFSLLIYVSLACGIVIAVLGIIFVRPVATLLGASGEMLEFCELYGRIILLALPAFMLQYEFQSFIFLAAFIGYAVGTAPVIGFHYGAGNHMELKSILKKSAVIISVFAVSMLIFGELLSYPLAKIFVGYDDGLLSLKLRLRL